MGLWAVCFTSNAQNVSALGQREEVIEVTPAILRDYPNAFRKARNERIRAVRLESDLWYCARRESGHGQYLIKFHVFPTVRGGEQVKAECRSVQGQRCKGCWGEDRMCVHIATVLLRGIKYGRAKQRRQAA